MAHTDIKLDNVAFDEVFKEVLLIDNGDIKKFGKLREVFTPHKNIRTKDIDKPWKWLIVDKNTDNLGFERLIKEINSL